jgi:hypothetical protein
MKMGLLARWGTFELRMGLWLCFKDVPIVVCGANLLPKAV